MPPRRTKAGGAKKRPTRYAAGTPTPPDLAAALRAHRKQSNAQAAALYEARLATTPTCLDSWMNLAALHVRAGRARAAAAAYAAAITLAPHDARVHRDAGIGLAATGALPAARYALTRAIALDPSLPGAHLCLGRLHLDNGDKDAALAVLAHARTLFPQDASVHLELHRALFDDRSPTACLAAAQHAVALDPEFALARLFLAGALGLDDRISEMHAALHPSHLIDPGLTDALAFALAHKPSGARFFATKREGLTFARAAAPTTGPILEFGVRHGVSTRILAEDTTTPLHAFDSFEGLPVAWQGRAEGAFTTAGERPELPPHVHLHVGRFETTLPPFTAGLTQSPRLVHIDSDLYESARVVLHTLAPVLVPGCVLVFDELIGNANWRQDEHRALTEAAQAFGWRCQPLAFSWITGQGIYRRAA